MRGGVRRPRADVAVAAVARRRARHDRPTRGVLGRALEAAAGAASRRRAARRAPRPRPAALARSCRATSRAPNASSADAARAHRRADPHDAARASPSSAPPRSAPTRCRSSAGPTPEHLYSATGLAPATYQSSTLTRRGRISRQGLPEHRDALMGIAWGLSQHSPAFRARDAELRARGMPTDPGPRRARPPRLPTGLATAAHPTALRRSALRSRQAGAGGDGHHSYAARRRNLACRPPARPLLTAHTKACRTTAPDQPAAHPAAAADDRSADSRKHRDHPSRR